MLCNAGMCTNFLPFQTYNFTSRELSLLKGTITICAKAYSRKVGIWSMPDFILPYEFKKLSFETKSKDIPRDGLWEINKKMIDKIIQFMRSKNYKIFTGTGEVNIIYIEGMNPQLTLNDDRPGEFNDARIVIGFEVEKPKLLGTWEATTEPGFYYTDNPMNPNGAARIAFDQYTAWQVGIHGNSEPHEALIQVGLVRVHRDYNKDMLRTDDKIDEGYFGINQHHGYNHHYKDIDTASAGCLVGRTRQGHYEFMDIIKSDPRYQADPDFIFTTTIIPGDKL
jgi:hypothetical protein